ncbi:excisionase family DNA-binding protein [Thalassobacillus sp. CUG 92003]|uniref:excisionase family DNA-binding protein n=1 Tax=Thalassobacillus sp. CUG 92003 TaxID=2736641 RepID=UPI0015E703F9|nr:excisionase family DNA-binding protein [Thalassobacillus sp. CUG 92003]
MYLTVKEAAAYLDLPEAYVQKLMLENKIRSVDDGKQVLINTDQFEHYFEQMETYHAMVQAYFNEPLPDDIDVKDED